MLIAKPLYFSFLSTAFQGSTKFHSPATTSLSATKKIILNYSYIPEVLEKRDPYRAEHLSLAQELSLKGGPVGGKGKEVPSGALFIFDSEEKANEFVEKDPYVSNGIVTNWDILEWNVVIDME